MTARGDAPPTSKAALRDAYAAWIAQEPFDVFLTVTSAKRTSPEGMHKRARWILSEWQKLLYGKNAIRKGLTIEGVTAIERQRNGNPHSHGLYRFPRIIELTPFQRAEMKLIADDGGFSKIEEPRCQDDVAGYLAKYVTKDGELFFTPNWTPVTVQHDWTIASHGRPALGFRQDRGRNK